MTIFQLFLAFGVTAGLLAILVVVTFDKMRKRLGDKDFDVSAPKTLAGGLGIGNTNAPAALLARMGQNAQTRMSLDTVVMVPTMGLRLISLGCAGVLLWLLWGPAMYGLLVGQGLNLLVSACIIYAVVYIAFYEATYNGDGISAPNWLFQTRHYPWEEFISIKDNGQYNYVLQFESGKMHLQKYLVGMPTFFTFVAEVREMNKSA